MLWRLFNLSRAASERHCVLWRSFHVHERSLHFVLAAVLLTAAAMKMFTAVTQPASARLGGEWLFVPPPFLIALELGLALWLISGVRREIVRLAALAVFAAFTGVSFASLVAGNQSCGCFGTGQVSPLVTMMIDVAAVAALVNCACGQTTQRTSYDLTVEKVS